MGYVFSQTHLVTLDKRLAVQATSLNNYSPDIVSDSSITRAGEGANVTILKMFPQKMKLKYCSFLLKIQPFTKKK
jgi:hypothetical protein